MALVLQSGIGFGSGNGKHNLGWYATVEALQEAYPEGKDGDYAVVGSTDTVWVWDSDSNAWVDTDTKGQVESVNNLTGVVVLTAEDVKAIPQLLSIPSATSENVNMIFQYKGTTTSSYTNGYFYKCIATESIQEVSVLPTASKEEENHIYKYTGETNSKYIQGKLYKCTSDGEQQVIFGEDPVEVFSWKEVITDISSVEDVSTLPQTSPAEDEGKICRYIGETTGMYTTGDIYKCGPVEAVNWDGSTSTFYIWKKMEYVENLDISYSWQQINVQPAVDPLPDQTGNAGKFLTTDGTDASWGDALVNTATGADSVTINGIPATGQKTVNIGYNCASGIWNQTVVIGNSCLAQSLYAIVIGTESSAGNYCVALGNRASAMGSSSIAIGERAVVPSGVSESIQLGYGTNNKPHTMSVGLGYYDGVYQNYTLLEKGGTIPTDRFTTTPVAAGTYMAKIVVDGQGTVTRSWGSAPDPLPSQTGNAGKVLGTDGTKAAWETKTTITFRTWGANE